MTLDQLQLELAALPDPLDIPPRRSEEYETRRSVLRARIETIRRASATLADVGPEIATLTGWHDFLDASRETLCAQLLALASGDQRQHGVKLSIMQIDRGLDFRNEGYPASLPLDDLLSAAGYASSRGTLARTCGEAWRGSLPEVEHRLAELQARRDDAQRRLDAALRDS